MLAPQIETVKAKNIAVREKRQQKKVARFKSKQERSHQKMASMNAFSETYTDRRANFIDRRIEKINKKYAIKIDNVGNSLSLRFLKFRLRFAEKHKENRVNKLQAKIDKGKTGQTLLDDFIGKRDARIAEIRAKIDEIPHKIEARHKAELAALEKSTKLIRLKGALALAEYKLDQRLGELQNEVASGKVDSSELDKLRQANSEKVSALQTKIKSFSEEINKKYESAIAHIENDKEFKRLNRQLKNTERKSEKQLSRLKKILPKQEKAASEAASRLQKLSAQPDKTIEELKVKIPPIVESEHQRTLQKEEKIRSKVDKNIFLKYYQLRVRYLQFIFGKRHQHLAHRVSLAAIASNVGEDRERRLQIDEATAYVRWDEKIAAIRDKALAGKTAVVRERLLKRQASEIKALTRRKEMPPAFTVFSGVRDAIEIGKSNYVAGFEIRGVLNRVSAHLRRFSMYYVFAGIVIIFGAATNWTNLQPGNIVNIIQNNLYILIIGLSMLLVIVSGAIDLSVGSMLGFCGTLSVYTYNLYGNLGATIVITLLLGLGYGLFQGFLIGYFKMPSFIVTLGGMLLFAGLSLFLTKGQTWSPTGNFESIYVQWVVGQFESPLAYEGDIHLASFFIIFCAGILVVVSMFFGRTKRAKYGIESGNFVGFLIKSAFILGLFGALGYFIGASDAGLRYYMIYLLVLAVIFMFVTQNTTFGRAIYAVGGNKRAAFLSGINVARTQMLVFGVIGVMTSFAALLFTGINVAASSLDGNGFELDVISSVFVGGASMTGGIGTVPGTLIGGMALGFINNGLYILNLGVDIQRIIRACILIGAVGYDIYTHRKIG